MNEVLKNLKIGDSFQEMLEKMDPHKICELDEDIKGIHINEVKTAKDFETLKRQVDQLRSKNEFVGLITPNQTKPQNFDKQ